VEIEGVSRRRLVQCVTLSKAFGCYGGAVLGSQRLRGQIMERSSLFQGSTPLPLPLAYAATVAVEILKRDKALRRRLNHNADFVKRSLRRTGMKLPDAPGPIVSFVQLTPAQNRRLSRALLAAGIFPSFINYPGAPAGGYFRFMISSEHTPAQLNQLVSVLEKFIP